MTLVISRCLILNAGSAACGRRRMRPVFLQNRIRPERDDREGLYLPYQREPYLVAACAATGKGNTGLNGCMVYETVSRTMLNSVNSCCGDPISRLVSFRHQSSSQPLSADARAARVRDAGFVRRVGWQELNFLRQFRNGPVPASSGGFGGSGNIPGRRAGAPRWLVSCPADWPRSAVHSPGNKTQSGERGVGCSSVVCADVAPAC